MQLSVAVTCEVKSGTTAWQFASAETVIAWRTGTNGRSGVRNDNSHIGLGGITASIGYLEGNHIGAHRQGDSQSGSGAEDIARGRPFISERPIAGVAGVRSIEGNLGLTVHALVGPGIRDRRAVAASRVEDKPFRNTAEIANTNNAACVVDVEGARKHPTGVRREQRVEVGQCAVLPNKSTGIIRYGDTFTDDLTAVVNGIGKAVSAAECAHVDQVA